MGCLLEHYSGALPLWLSPVQAVLIPVAKAHEDYCLKTAGRMETEGIRTAVYDSSDTLNKRIRQAEGEKVPYMLVAGEREAAAGNLTVRKRGSREQAVLSVEDFIQKCAGEIKARS